MTDVFLRPLSADPMLWDPTVAGAPGSVAQAAGSAVALGVGAWLIAARAESSGQATVAGVSDVTGSNYPVVEFPRVTPLPGAVQWLRPRYVGESMPRYVSETRG